MNSKNIWGTICECGNEVYNFYDDHPWQDELIIKEVRCNKCNKLHKIDNDIASDFYNKKIFNCFSNLSGKVLEIGCGGGLITNYITSLKNVSYVATLDIDEESISKISNKHYKVNLNDFDESIFDIKFDYVICRDVLMYLNDIDYTFNKLSKISNKVILLNWYDINHKNCLNKTSPTDILNILSNYYENLTIDYPFFYKKGYLIKTKI